MKLMKIFWKIEIFEIVYKIHACQTSAVLSGSPLPLKILHFSVTRLGVHCTGVCGSQTGLPFCVSTSYIPSTLETCMSRKYDAEMRPKTYIQFSRIDEKYKNERSLSIEKLPTLWWPKFNLRPRLHTSCPRIQRLEFNSVIALYKSI